MEDVRASRRNRVLIGNLPDDFLRISYPQNYEQETRNNVLPAYVTGSFKITVVEAELAKNYGLTKMDPYVQIRVGHNVYETHADLRGGRHPLWNKTFQTFLPQGIRTIFFDIYDERALIPDVRIAWGSYTLPDELFKGEYVDTWVNLTGKLGDEKEGKIHVICNFAPANVQPSSIMYPSAPVMVMTAPYYNGIPYYTTGPHVAVPYGTNQQCQTNSCAQQQNQNNTQASNAEVYEAVFTGFEHTLY